MREIAFDTETTGFDPERGDRIVEIGCVEMINRIRTGREFHCYINPQRDVPPGAAEVHGLTTDFLRDKPVFRDVCQPFIDFVGDAPLIIHNAVFDMKFINWELRQLGLDMICNSRAICTLVMARQKFPGSPATLDALCKRFNICLDARDKHGALIDAMLLADVYLELTGGRQSSLIVSENRSRETRMALKPATPVNLPKREFLPSTEECGRHAKFIEEINNPIWKTVA